MRIPFLSGENGGITFCTVTATFPIFLCRSVDSSRRQNSSPILASDARRFIKKSSITFNSSSFFFVLLIFLLFRRSQTGQEKAIQYFLIWHRLRQHLFFCENAGDMPEILCRTGNVSANCFSLFIILIICFFDNCVNSFSCKINVYTKCHFKIRAKISYPYRLHFEIARFSFDFILCKALSVDLSSLPNTFAIWL